MANKPKKPAAAKSSKQITDVAHPDTAPPPDTSKPIITPRPIMKDPMVTGQDAQTEDPEMPSSSGAGHLLGKVGETKIKPLSEAEKPDDETASVEKADETSEPAGTAEAAKTEPDDAEAEEKTDADDKPDAGTPEATAPGKGKATVKKAADEEAEAAAKAAADAKVRKLVESKQYFLPINAVEHRRSARVAAAGIILALILAVAWVDVALDAGLIHLGGVKPVTHLFTN